MNSDIVPPRPPEPPRRSPEVMPRPLSQAPYQQPSSTPSAPSSHALDHLDKIELSDRTPPPKKSKKKQLWIVAGGLLVLLLVVAAGSVWWYKNALRPVSSVEDRIRIEITAGSTPSQIADLLVEKKLIRSDLAFDIHTRLHGVHSLLQAGIHSLSPSESTPEIVTHLTSGKTDTFNLTLYPGGVLKDRTDKPASQRTDVTSMLLSVGYSQSEIDKALNRSYASEFPLLFSDKPASATLEGYVYGDTYNFTANTPVEDVLRRTFAEFESVVRKEDLVAKYKQQGLNLYEGITLASIVQREVDGNSDDQKVVAQIFYKRLGISMPLGADATFVYAAGQRGVTPSVDLDSPYNTRVHTGLPPGPISAPGLKALQAVASPAATDYLYFVSGDDGKNYFSKTLEEHEANTKAHCQQNCQLF